MSAPALEARGLAKSYRGRRVVDGVSFRVAPGEVVGLLGPNGAGKTTCFNMTVGLVRPDAGTVRLGDEDLTRLPMHLRARRGVGYLPQEASVFRKLTVRQNFTAVLEALGRGRAERERRADELLEEFHLGQVENSLGEQLSGGERRRTEVARSLLNRAKGIGVLLTDHSVREALGICDRAYILSSGQILEEGTPAHIAGSARARAVYLGEKFRLDDERHPEVRP